MIILPAIDLQAGQVVRLKRGDFSGKIVYSNDPIGIAKDWERQGATWLHVVDLDGAMTGEFKNLNLIGNIGRSVGCAIEIGGGRAAGRRFFRPRSVKIFPLPALPGGGRARRICPEADADSRKRRGW